MGVPRTKRLLALSTIPLIIAAWAWSSAGGTGVTASLDASEAAPFMRVVKVVDHPWHKTCTGVECGSTDYPIRSFDTAIPTGVARFDVVLTLTINFRLSAADRAASHVFHCPNADLPVPCPLSFLAPDLLPLAPTKGATTTTLQWYGKGFPTADYLGWHYELHAQFVDGSGDGQVTISGSKMVASFEMTPSG